MTTDNPPRFQVELFDDEGGLKAMQQRVNRWLDAAHGELQIVDRQTIATSRSALGYDGKVLETAVIIAIWYVAPPLQTGIIARAFDAPPGDV